MGHNPDPSGLLRALILWTITTRVMPSAAFFADI
jgi:hypothetical protein